MSSSIAFDQTSARLVEARAKRLQTWLQIHRDEIHSGDTRAVADVINSMPPVESEETGQAKVPYNGEGLDVKETKTPFYFKLKGKGKGKAVMFEEGRSCVAQVHEYAAQMSLPDPIFSHTMSGAAHFPRFTVKVTFDGLRATNGEDFASSIKEAKEQACAVLVEKILRRNREVYGLRA